MKHIHINYMDMKLLITIVNYTKKGSIVLTFHNKSKGFKTIIQTEPSKTYLTLVSSYKTFIFN